MPRSSQQRRGSRSATPPYSALRTRLRHFCALKGMLMASFLAGDRIGLRALEPEDAAQFASWFADRDVVRYALSSYQMPTSLAETRAWLERTIADKATLTLGITLRETGTLIGYAGIAGISRINRSGEYFILIGDKECWGRGYGTETTRLIVDYGFGSLNLHRIALTVSVPNAGGVAAYARAGFRQEGVLRQACYRDGQFHDKIVMAILRPEWEQLRNGALS